MADKPEPVPNGMSIAEASEFWDEHSVADYSSQVVELEFEPESRSTFVAVEDGLVEQLRGRAKETGVSVETLVNLWLQEKLMASG